MNILPTDFTVTRATAATLPDAYALHTDPADAAERLQRFRERMAEGKVTPEQFVILRSERGVEAVTLVANNHHVPLFSHTRADTPHAGLTQFYAYLREAEPQKTLILDSTQNVMDAAPVLAAGWILDDEQIVYETDLTARGWDLAPEALEGGPELLKRPEIAALLQELGQDDWETAPEWHIVALPDEHGQPVALAAVGPSNRPGFSNINMIGVRETERGKGLGQRLHAHLLARAAERFTHHAGGTEASNAAMQRIFERNGSRLTSRQLYFKAG